MTDRLTRAVVDRLAELRDIANVIKSVIAEDAAGRVTFADLAGTIAPKLYRAASPALHRDIRQACRLLGLATTTMHGGFRVVRGVRLR